MRIGKKMVWYTCLLVRLLVFLVLLPFIVLFYVFTQIMQECHRGKDEHGKRSVERTTAARA